jgi:hypothetical protein
MAINNKIELDLKQSRPHDNIEEIVKALDALSGAERRPDGPQ